MLADQINEETGVVHPDGTTHDALLAPLRERVGRAKVYVFGPEAVQMAANVAMGKPSSMLAALPWVRLPAPETWIEFSNLDLRQAMAAMGSPNLTPPNTAVTILRTGFLMREVAGNLVVDYVHADRTPDGRTMLDLAPVRMRFELDPDRPLVAPALGLAVPEEARGRVRAHLKLISENPAEAAAESSLRERFFYGPHPDMAPLARFLAQVKGAAFVRKVEEDQGSEGWRLFHAVALPALILLNCRNAVEVEEVEPSAKLNRTRVAKGRAPLRPHGLVRMHLTAARRAMTASGGAGRGAVASAFVIGHFKVRSGGIFWWSPHVRVGIGDPVARPTAVR